LALRLAASRAIKSSGSGWPVLWCLDRRLRIDGCQHQFSSIWLGASTKSRSTLVPLIDQEGRGVKRLQTSERNTPV
jgi:hypothetical protein